ncbi:MAG TPA: cyclic nucleotide-binding domain-containing protein [Trebonia sp.]
MRYESTVTSLSWIPSEAVTGGTKAAFEGGFTHYDQPPPGDVARPGAPGDVEELQRADRFRFANVLSAWIETDGAGAVTGAGYAANSGGLMGATTVRVGPARRTFQAVGLPDLRHAPEHGDGWVRFTQTTGGRTGMPAPRRVAHPPFLQWQAPTVWTTLTLTLHASGQAEIGVPGASRFPRHWVYDPTGKLARKSGLTDFSDWYRKSFGKHTPWGDEDSSALVVAVETALERELSVRLMHGGAKPRIAAYPAGATLVRQDAPGTDVYLVLDGVIRVERNGEFLAEYGPGALLGERAHLEAGTRTASLVAATPCKVASVDGAALDRSALTELSGQHRREEV